MATTTEVVLAKGGTLERKVRVTLVQIPDLWHVAQWVRGQGADAMADKILETWQIAHNLKTHIMEQE